MRRRGWNQDRGGAPALVAVMLGGIALGLVLVVVSAEVRVRTARAQWAADGAARAAAAEVVPASGPSPVPSSAGRAAAEVAEANGARLVSIEVIDRVRPPPVVGTTAPLAVSPTVVVTVELAGIEARAAAARFAVGRR